VRQAMGQDWSWDQSARKYLSLYKRAVDAPPLAVHVP